MLHDAMKAWVDQVRDWGYGGVFFMMALESTIVPIPSEVIMPPASWWVTQGEFSFWPLVLAGALGSTFGSSLCYAFTYTVGRSFVLRYGRWFLLPPDKLVLAEQWLADYALIGIFFARLLPVLRHLVGFPAGLVRVPFWQFALTTFAGSFLWCTILTWIGEATLRKHPTLMDDPEALVEVVKGELFWFVLLAAILGGGFLIVKAYATRVKNRAAAAAPPPST